MGMTIVSGTNREGSYTLKLAKEYQRILVEKKVEASLFSLEGVNLLNWDKAFEQIELNVIIPTSCFIFIIPEYNGSFPGSLKVLFDTCSSHEIWFNKRALITGNATGRAGNLRGMDHLADILNYLKITVHPNKLPISAINQVMSDEGKLINKVTIEVINQQLDEFISWLDYFPVEK